MSDLRKVVRGALIQTINDHGPITNANAESAAKRVNGAIRQELKSVRKRNFVAVTRPDGTWLHVNLDHILKMEWLEDTGVTQLLSVGGNITMVQERFFYVRGELQAQVWPREEVSVE